MLLLRMIEFDYTIDKDLMIRLLRTCCNSIISVKIIKS